MIDKAVMNTIVRNKVQSGKYVFFSFSNGDIPEILFQGLDDKHWNILLEEVKDIRAKQLPQSNNGA